MTGEVHLPAAEVCVSIAQEVQALKAANVLTSSAHLEMLLSQLCCAPASGTVDSLALAAVARKILASCIEQCDTIDTPDPEQATLLLAFTYLHRAVEALEVETGLSAEGFTGEAETIN